MGLSATGAGSGLFKRGFKLLPKLGLIAVKDVVATMAKVGSQERVNRIVLMFPSLPHWLTQRYS